MCSAATNVRLILKFKSSYPRKFTMPSSRRDAFYLASSTLFPSIYSFTLPFQLVYLVAVPFFLWQFNVVSSEIEIFRLLVLSSGTCQAFLPRFSVTLSHFYLYARTEGFILSLPFCFMASARYMLFHIRCPLFVHSYVGAFYVSCFLP